MKLSWLPGCFCFCFSLWLLCFWFVCFLVWFACFKAFQMFCIITCKFTLQSWNDRRCPELDRQLQKKLATTSYDLFKLTFRPIRRPSQPFRSWCWLRRFFIYFFLGGVFCIVFVFACFPPNNRHPVGSPPSLFYAASGTSNQVSCASDSTE